MGFAFICINYYAPNNQFFDLLKVPKEIQENLKVFKLLIELVKFGRGGTVFLTNHSTQWEVISNFIT